MSSQKVLARITPAAFVIPFSREGEDGQAISYVAYVKVPGEAELVAMAKSLGFLFSKFQRSVAEGLDFLVLVKDWRIYLEEFLGEGKNAERQQYVLDAFFERRLNNSEIFCTDTGEAIESLDADEAESLKGSLLFFLSIYRYAPQVLRSVEMKSFLTSLNFTDYRSSLLKSADAPHTQSTEKTKTMSKQSSKASSVKIGGGSIQTA